MSRFVVTAVFLFFTFATGSEALGAFQTAFAEGDLEHWVVAVYSALKAGIVLAFAYFVFARPPSKRRSRDPIAFVACAAALGSIVFLREPTGSTATELVLAGEVVTLLSFAWLVASVLALGKCFGILPEARGLVTRGPYRLARHPVYLGELGACVGLVIAAPSIWNTGVAVVFYVAQSVRMRLEERALTKEFPEYAEYATRTPRLFPRPLRPSPLSGPRPVAEQAE
jgi:protein-S-isoprenylcysteine O-methyltransferase Ste14